MTGTLLPGWALDLSNTAVTTGAGFLVQSTIIIAVGLALAFVLRRRGAAAQSAILRAFLVAVFLCPPSTILLQWAGVRGITFEIPLAPAVRTNRSTGISSVPASTVTAPENMAPALIRTENSTLPASSFSPVMLKNRLPRTLNGNQSARSRPNPPAVHRDSRGSASHNFKALLALFFTLLWAASTLFLLGRLLLHHFYILTLRHSAVVAKLSALSACRAAAHTLGIRPIPVIQNPSVQSPFLAGILRPCVFLPLGGVETVLEERSVFLHELAHLARHDISWNLARQVGVALFPFQPLLWVLSARIEEMSDYACDDYVTHATGMHRTYADSLIAIARQSRPSLREAVAGVGIISF